MNFLSLDGYDQDFSRNTVYTAALATLSQESKEKCVLYAALDLQNSNTRSGFLWNAVNRFVRFVKRANTGISDATVMAQESLVGSRFMVLLFSAFLHDDKHCQF